MTTGGIVGSLRVNIIATTDKFISGLNKAATWLGRFTAKANSVSGSLASLFTSANAIVAAIGLIVGATVKAAIESGSHIYELTKKLRVSSEAITALHFAAEQLESSAAAVDDAIAKMSVTLGSALRGSRETATAFGELGLNINQLTKLSPDKQFLAVVDALHQMNDASKAAAIRQAIFGRGSKELSALITVGAQKIVEEAQAAATAGNLMGSSVAKSLDNSGDALKRLGASWRNFRDEFVSLLEPVISFVTWFGTKAIQAIKIVFDTFRTGFAAMYEGAAYSILGIVKLMNLILPKKWKIGTEGLSNFAKGAGQQRSEEWNRANDQAAAFFGVGNAQKNPLQAPNTQVEKNTATISDKMDELIAVMKAKNSGTAPAPATTAAPVQLYTAGVR